MTSIWFLQVPSERVYSKTEEFAPLVRSGTIKVNTNATYETIDTQIKKNWNRRTALDWSAGKLLGVLDQFYSIETQPYF